MSEIVERVARAIGEMQSAQMAARYPKRYGVESLPWEQIGSGAKAEARQTARAAIEAMREPTEAMDLAGLDAESYRSLGLLKVRRVWQSMIDAALKEPT